MPISNKKKKAKDEANQMMQEILSTDIWYMEPQYLKNFLETARSKDISKELSEIVQSASNNEELFFALFDEDDKDKKPYEVENGIATINIRGPLLKRASGFMARIFGIVGMEQIGKNYNIALADEKVDGIFLHTDSPGGTADGTPTLSDIIYAGRGIKPIMAFVDGAMTSAAYWIGSAADYIVMAEPIAKVGSTGAVVVHESVENRAKELGFEITVFASGSYKKIGNMYENLSKKDKEYIQNRTEFFHNEILQGVSKNLGIPVNKLSKDVRESKIFLGQEGIDVGLAHEIMSKDQALAKLRSVIDGKESFNEPIKKVSKSKGGVKTMSEETIKQLELKIENLKTDLKNKDADIEKLTTDFQSEINDLKTENAQLAETNENLSQEIEGLKVNAKNDKSFVEVGKQAIETCREDIKKISVQVKGDDYNENLLAKQLEAFGDDYEALTMFKVDLEKQRDKSFKQGDINADEQKTEVTEKKEKYDIGKKIGESKLSVVK